MRALVGLLALAAFAFAPAQLMDMMDMQKVVASPMYLLQNAAVQKELKLSGKQKSEIKKICDELTKAGRGADPNSMGALSQMNAAFSEADRKLMEQLDEPQKLRFREIRYQVLAMRSLGESEVQAALEMTDDQKLKVKEYEKAERDGFLETARKGASGLKNWNKGRDKREEELAKILTTVQAEKLKALMGAPFKDAKKIRG